MQYPEPPEGLRRALSPLVPLAAFRVAGAVPRASQKGLRRALSPLVPLAVFLVAGAVPRASRRGCGARGGRWCRWQSSWQAQYPEPPEGAAARCRRWCRLLSSSWQAQYPEPHRRGLSPLVPLAVFLVAGAVPRASRRGCGARCRCWCRLLSSWQAQW